MTFEEWQERERKALQQRVKEQLAATGKRKLNYIQQRLVDARLDSIRDGRMEYERAAQQPQT